ncbi:hypothetical protein JJV70_03540 [Streptomyces sp. JJ66]|uniref:hypothetical protein n=1 Tax=Streptomyces sp. JJ66 TaxID=2803843 RepID=UPI001C564165|nr:hypothetical protein [Streptomyces sp. JJ66]MBW1601190.1 hypothetical protein [Streptomyces sp. JJ66]
MAMVAVTISGCGGSNGGQTSDAIEDTGDRTTSSASPTTKAPAAPPAPRFTLPPDVTVEVESPDTGDAGKAAVLHDVEYSVKARIEAVAKGEGSTPHLSRYFTGSAFRYWNDKIEEKRENGETVAGTYRFFGLEVTELKGDVAAARFCEDQSAVYEKTRNTGEVRRDKPLETEVVQITLGAEKSDEGVWQVNRFSWNKGVPACERD